MAILKASYRLRLQALLTIVLVATLTQACSKSKPKVIAHCVGVSLSAEKAAGGIAETVTRCGKTVAECQKLKIALNNDTAGKCAPTAKLWCSGSEYCAPTLKRCELNQENLNRSAEADGSERTSLTCRQVHSLPDQPGD